MIESRTLKGPTQMGRWIQPTHWAVAATSQVFTAGTVLLAQFAVPTSCMIDGLAYVVGAATSGNVIGGILGPVARSGDTATGAAVLAQSASTAMGSTNTPQVLTWASVRVVPGIYYAALEADNATGTYMRIGNQLQATGITATYARGGGYGALTDPTPTVTATGNLIPGLLIRVV